MPSLKPRVNKKDSISKDDVCYLISKTIAKDELEQEIEVEEERQVFCAPISIGQREFSAAFVNGLKPEMVLVIDHDEYDGEEKVVYHDKQYTIYRTFTRDDGDIELYCTLKVGG